MLPSFGSRSNEYVVKPHKSCKTKIDEKRLKTRTCLEVSCACPKDPRKSSKKTTRYHRNQSQNKTCVTPTASPGLTQAIYSVTANHLTGLKRSAKCTLRLVRQLLGRVVVRSLLDFKEPCCFRKQEKYLACDAHHGTRLSNNRVPWTEFSMQVDEEVRSHLHFLQRNSYAALQLPSPHDALANPGCGITDVEVKHNYRRLALRFHPGNKAFRRKMKCPHSYLILVAEVFPSLTST